MTVMARRLNHVLGREYGTDAQMMAQLISWIEANLRLGNSMTIDISKYGDVDLRARDES